MATTGQHQHLPAEIWERVLENLKHDNDLPSLWMFRQVCTTFKNQIDFIFRQIHLPKTWIDIRFGNDLSDDETDIFNCSFGFSHLSEDNATAFFRMEELTGEGDEPTSFIYEYLQTYATEMPFAIQQPQHVIQIRRYLNDAPLPGISFHFDNPEDAARMSHSAKPTPDDFKGLEKLQLSCDWRELYARFWGEEWLCNDINENWLKNQTERARGKIDRGEADPMAFLQQLLNEYAGKIHDGRKFARRARVRRQRKELEGQGVASQNIGTEEEESRILKSLAVKQHWVSFVEFSDDEEKEEEEEEWEEYEDEEDEEEEEEAEE